MRTRTIYSALKQAEYRQRRAHLSHRERFYQLNDAEKRMQLRIARFEVELLRRMDERDAMVAKAKAWDAFVLWAMEPDQLKYSREREWGEWMDIFTGWVGHAFPEVWPMARPPYVRDQWYIDQENKR
jgi:hypothetical protein